MEAETPQPALMIGPRQRVSLVDEIVAAVKGGVETGDLRRKGKDFARRVDAGHVVRLMQRRQRLQVSELFQHAFVDDRRRGIVHASVHDSVADGLDRDLRERFLEPFEDLLDAGRVVSPGHRLLERLAVNDRDREGRLRPQALDLALGQEAGPRRRRSKQSEFDRGRSGVQRENVIDHGLDSTNCANSSERSSALAGSSCAT